MFYKNQPHYLQSLLLSSRSVFRSFIREGRAMRLVQDEIEQLEYDKNRANDFIHKQLRLQVTNAFENTPYYSRLDFSIDNVDNYVDVLKLLPLMEKSTYLTRGDLFLNQNYKGFTIKGASSGTTGVPLSVPQSLESVIRESAFVWRQLKWAGYQPGDKRAWLRGDMIVPVDSLTAPFWRYSYFENMLLFSSFHLEEKTISLYIKAMVDFGTNIIQAYPSSIVAIAKYLRHRKMNYPGKIKAIITSSETLSIWDRKLLESTFQCAVFDWYGLFERVAAIGTCEYGRYHQLTDYSYVEFHERDGGLHEIVGTNFNNNLFPFLRYKTNDFVTLSNKQCPCGRHYPVVDNVEGRSRDYLITDRGKRLTMVSQLYKNINGIYAAQFIQESIRKLDVLLVVDASEYNAFSRSLLISNIKRKLGNSIDVVTFIVDSIPRTQNGKVKHAICNIEEF
ncbi:MULTISPECIES: phenylacetate--CoA ligase family protein [unclassified Motilimonas]|uniref:phenylacetate--CoA ligase family protein n=1 Tax=unclassified Motilimonas TaxID=2643697 RepID=UPI001E2C0398|nr:MULTISPECIES: phenylacetate--CoA ligase family protein [unclassified Motilimonas]MCE0555607.1 phenylacetate--CoA ligase family protein [Motilimonas sp. E26]MDO6526641.1 phenylacetate--CoA ligase family protein [Motilimonas sp. 1_MG-2023]